MPLFGSEPWDRHFQFSCGCMSARPQQDFHKLRPRAAAKQLLRPDRCQPEASECETEEPSPVPGCRCSSGSSRHLTRTVTPAGREGSSKGRGWKPGPVASAAGVCARSHICSAWNNRGPWAARGEELTGEPGAHLDTCFKLSSNIFTGTNFTNNHFRVEPEPVPAVFIAATCLFEQTKLGASGIYTAVMFLPTPPTTQCCPWMSKMTTNIHDTFLEASPSLQLSSVRGIS